MDGSTVMVTIVLWIVLLEYVLVRALSNFAARKLCHAGCGLGIMLLDSKSASARYFVWGVASSSIMMTWNLSPLPAFRFSRRGDVGITIYLLLVSAWFYAELSPLILAPVFFADPAGAVVGKWCSRNVAASLSRSAGAPQGPRRWAHRRYSNTNCNGSQCIEMQWYTYRFIVLKKVT